MKKIKEAIAYYKELDSAINFIKKPKNRQKGVTRTALAALKTIQFYCDTTGDAGWILTKNMELKFNEFLKEI